MSLIDAEKSRHLPNDLVEWTIELGINGAGSALGQHGANHENGDGAGQGDDLDGQIEDDRRVCRGRAGTFYRLYAFCYQAIPY